jgi:hypothetical protein
LTHGPTFSEATDLQGRYRPFQVNVNDRGGETNTNLASNLQSHTQLNEPISRDFSHLEVETRMRAPIKLIRRRNGQETTIETAEEASTDEVTHDKGPPAARPTQRGRGHHFELKVVRNKNGPICRDFPHLQVEARFGLQQQAKENKVAKKKELKKAKKIQPTKTLCCSGTH